MKICCTLLIYVLSVRSVGYNLVLPARTKSTVCSSILAHGPVITPSAVFPLTLWRYALCLVLLYIIVVGSEDIHRKLAAALTISNVEDSQRCVTAVHMYPICFWLFSHRVQYYHPVVFGFLLRSNTPQPPCAGPLLCLTFWFEKLYAVITCMFNTG